MEWISTDEEPKDGQKVDLCLQKWDITGKESIRLTDCTYYVEHGYLDSDNRAIAKTYQHSIEYWMPVPELPNIGQ